MSDSSERPVDVGIVVALPEELRELLGLIGAYTRHPATDLDAYLFPRGAYRCAALLVGEMGQTQASMFTERLIARLDPGVILSIGIAGDVHAPSQASEYIQDSKAEPAAGGGFAIVHGAPAYRADFALLRAVRAFEFDHPAGHRRWVEASIPTHATSPEPVATSTRCSPSPPAAASASMRPTHIWRMPASASPRAA